MLFSIGSIKEAFSSDIDTYEIEDSSESSYYESALEFIIESRRKAESNFIADTKLNVSKMVDDFKSNPKSFVLSKIPKVLNFTILYYPMLEEMTRMNQECYDKIVEQVKLDKKDKIYREISGRSKDIPYCKYLNYTEPYYASYTNITLDKNSASIKTDLARILQFINDTMRSISKSTRPSDIEMIMMSVKEFNDRYKDKEIPLILGRLVGQYAVDEENYPAELFKYFRDNKSEPMLIYNKPNGETNIDIRVLKDAVNGYLSVQDDLKYNITFSRKMSDQVKHITSAMSDTKYTLPEDIITFNLIKELIKLYNLPSTVIGYYLLFYGAKLDALDERFSRDRKMCKEAVKSLRKEDNE